MPTEPPASSEAVEASTADRVPETETRMASEIYGLIVASSVLAAGSQDDGILQVALTVLITLVVYWLAETYAHVMAVRHVRGHGLSWAHSRHDLRRGWPLVSASFIPLLVVVGAAILGADVSAAQNAGLICATVLLFSSGLVAGRRSGLTGYKLALAALTAAGFGIALIGLKAALH